MKKIIVFLLIILGAFAAGGWLGYSYSREVYIQGPVVTVTTFKDSTIYKIIKKPFKVSEQLFLTDTIFIDTSTIVKDYFYSRKYADTLVNDSNISIFYDGTVFKNTLDSLAIKYHFNRPFTTIYTTTPPPPIHQSNSLTFHAGGALMLGSQETTPFAVGGVIVKKNIINVGYSPFKNTIFVSLTRIF
jgi:hypothetical protein